MPYIKPKKEINRKAAERMPGLDNLVATWSHDDIIADYMSKLREYFDKALGKKLSELIAITTATLTDCGHCVGHHSEGAREAGYSDRQLEMIRRLKLTDNPLWEDNKKMFKDRERAVIGFVYNSAWNLIKGYDDPATAYKSRKTAWTRLEKQFPNEKKRFLILMRYGYAVDCNATNKQNETEV